VAAESGRMDIVKYLVGKGAELKENKDGVGNYTKHRLILLISV